ncbi:hypothetical protein [Mycoplasma suis]|uniref:Uncharacterized protein n=2 Tax=Mycoplasma suis TaxID=57372 RepID=F0QQ91_MYCSL|nr:hypothetical protein [Mycoplasma suis]ADX97661.1 hypothetical protein MSU_0117 [Mycoplasma suis str. Illinois]CBZ40198.1 hypothetical protein MSUIS_01050 [Mycoplasma suis KI3806]
MLSIAAWTKIGVTLLALGGAASGTYYFGNDLITQNSSVDQKPTSSFSNGRNDDASDSQKPLNEDKAENNSPSENNEPEASDSVGESGILNLLPEKQPNETQNPFIGNKEESPDLLVQEDRREEDDRVGVPEQSGAHFPKQPNVIAENIYSWSGGDSDLTCDRIVLENSSSGDYFSNEDCKNLFNSIWGERQEKRPELLMRISEEYLWNVFKGKLPIPSEINDSEKLKENLKSGLLIDEKICTSDLKVQEGKIIVTCNSQSLS